MCRIITFIDTYFVEKFGFNRETQIVAFSGDNPCSIAGLCLSKPGQIAISLGTSDTLFSILKGMCQLNTLSTSYVPTHNTHTTH
jgi:sugar (pentulose or hexulose) kinase